LTVRIGKPAEGRETENFLEVSIMASLPSLRNKIRFIPSAAVMWGNEYVPVISFIGHELRLRFNSLVPTELKLNATYTIELKKDTKELVLVPTDSSRRNVVNKIKPVSDGVILKRRYIRNGYLFVPTPIMEDTDTLKIVSMTVFVHLLELWSGTSANAPINPASQLVEDFVITTRFITPYVLTQWNRSGSDLRYHTPYGMYLINQNGDGEMDNTTNDDET
jgi:hypothetical protein